MVGFPRHARGEIGQQVQACPADILDGRVALQRRVQFIPLQDVAEVTNARGSKRLDRPGRDRVDADIVTAKINREILDRRLQRGLGHAHDVVMWDHLFRAIIAQRQHGAAIGHHRCGALGNGGEAVDGDVHRHQEVVERGVAIAAPQLILV